MRSPSWLIPIASIVVLSAGVCWSDAVEDRSDAAEEARRDADLRSFDHVWTTIRDTHWDPELGGLDWEAVRGELRPKVAEASTSEEARAVLRELIARLGQSHFAIIPADLYEVLEPVEEDDDEDIAGFDAGKGVAPREDDEGDAEGTRHGSVGIDLRVLDGVAVITRVNSQSPADAAGVRPGWVVEAADGDEFGTIIERHLERGAGETGEETLLTMSLLARLEGRIGATRSLRLLDGEDQPVELELAVAEEPGERVRLGYLTPMSVWISSRRLPSNVGYVAFNAFLDPGRVMPEFNRSVQSFMDAEGIIIDVRGNPGGIGGMAMGMAGWFIDRSGQYLGTMTTRDGALKFVVFPRGEIFAGPVAVLVDALSASTAEIFAGGLQDLGRARVFGTRSAGMALPSRIEKLANGDGFQFAVANYVSAGGETLEARGVIPDEKVEPSREALLAGRDAVLEAAERWILNQGSGSAGECVNPDST